MSDSESASSSSGNEAELDYEAERLRRIEENRQLLLQLGIAPVEAKPVPPVKKTVSEDSKRRTMKRLAKMEATPRKLTARQLAVLEKAGKAPKARIDDKTVKKPRKVKPPVRHDQAVNEPPKPRNLRDEYALVFPRSQLLAHMTSSLRLVTPRSLKAASTGGFTRPLALAARADLMALLDLLDLREGNPGRFAYHLRKAVRVRIGELEEDIEARLDELEREYAEANGQSFQAALFEEDEKARERAAEEKKQILAERHRLAEEARQARLEAKLARQRVQAEDDERRATKRARI